MNNNNSVGSGINTRHIYGFVSISLGITGTALGIMHLQQNKKLVSFLDHKFKTIDIKTGIDNTPKILEELKKMEGFKNEVEKIKEEFNKRGMEWKSDLFKKEKFTQETLEGLSARIEAILETKNNDVDLSPIIQKIEEKHNLLFSEVNENYEAIMDTLTHVNNVNEVKHHNLFTEVNENYEAIVDTLTHVKNDNLIKNKDLLEKLKVLETKLLSQTQQHAKVISFDFNQKFDTLKKEVIDINAFNEQQENRQKMVNNQLLRSMQQVMQDQTDNKNDYSGLVKFMEDNNEVNYQNLKLISKGLEDIDKKLSEGFADVEREIWTLGADVGFYSEDILKQGHEIKRKIKRTSDMLTKKIEKITEERGADLETVNMYIVLLGDLVNCLTPST